MSEKDVIWVDAAGRSTGYPRSGTSPYVPAAVRDEAANMIATLKAENADLSVRLDMRTTERDFVTQENERLREAIGDVTKLVNAQAEDEGLWFIADSIVEAYFQQELRKLHAAIEKAAALAANGEG